MKDDVDMDRYIGSGFRDDLAALINRYSMENGSDTPDYVLATFLTSCLMAFDAAVCGRTRMQYKDAKRMVTK